MSVGSRLFTAAGAWAPERTDKGSPDVDAVLFAPVSHAAAAAVVGGAASVVGVAVTQPWLTAVGVGAVVATTALQVHAARAGDRKPR